MENETPASDPVELTDDLRHLQEAKRLLAEDLVPSAIMELRAAIQENDGLHEAHYLLGEAYLGMEDWENAAEEFAKAGDHNLRMTYDYVAKIAPQVKIPLDDLIKGMPQDFGPILSDAKKTDEEARRRSQEAAALARLEDEKKKSEAAAKNALDPEEPLPVNMAPYLTNTTAPVVLTAISGVFWGVGPVFVGSFAGLRFLVIQAVLVFFYFKESGFPAFALDLVRVKLPGLADWLVAQFPLSGAGQISAQIRGSYFFTQKLGMDPTGIGTTLDDMVWPAAAFLFWIIVAVFALKSMIDAWFRTTKRWLSGYVSELRNQDVWVNFGFDQYVEAGDQFRIYQRTKYLKTVKARVTVTAIEDNKSVVEARAEREPETGKPYEIKIGDVVRK